MEQIVEVSDGWGVMPGRQVSSHADDPLDVGHEAAVGAEV